MDYIDVAILAAKEAGKIHKKYFESDMQVKMKSSSFDLVTVADVESERLIVSVIKEHFPDHNFLAEEGKYEKTDSQFKWIIDPLDGTNNFASRLPIFCSSIALSKDDELILGVIYDVTRDELFSAQKGKGAFLNGKKITVSSIDTLEQVLIITGFYYNRGQDMLDTLANIKKFFQKRIMGLRRLGSAALDLCYVACGRVSGFWEFELSPWDFAAGTLIIEEAGGVVTDKENKKVDINKKSFIVASNAKIHEQMLSVLK